MSRGLLIPSQQPAVDRAGRAIGLCFAWADGAYFNNGATQGSVPAFPVAVKDTTGSGDAFVAGLALQISQLDRAIAALEQTALQRIVRFANACGALTATQLGAMSALPSLCEVEQQLLGANPLDKKG